MAGNINNVTVIGTGVIGTGWIIRILAHNKKVVAFDKDIKQEKKVIKEIKRTWPNVKKLFNKKTLNLNKFQFVNSIEEAVKEADFIQECATENYSLKTKLMHNIDKYAKPNAIISSSSSGLLPSRIYPNLQYLHILHLQCAMLLSIKPLAIYQPNIQAILFLPIRDS